MALLNHLGHSREGWAGMHEKQLQSRAKVVLARLAVTRECEAILRTTTVAQVPDLASLTLVGEGIALIVSELALTGRCYELQHVCLMDVSEFEAGLDEMVAGIEIAVVLQSRSVAAGRGVEAQ